MGCYVETQNKEKWLMDNHNGWYAMQMPKWERLNIDGYRPVVLVDNGPFRAAGIAYDEQEYERFTDPRDERPKQVFLVSIEKLKEVSDIEEWLKRSEQ